MVNRRYIVGIVLIIISFFLFSCSKNKNLNVKTSCISLKTVYPGKYISLNTANSRLYTVFSDHELKNLMLLSIDTNKPINKQPINSETIDVIDTSPEINPFFGNHSFLITGRGMDLFYIDQQTEEKFILKWLSRKTAKDVWNVNTINPAGKIVAGIPYADNQILLVWNGNKLYYRMFYAKRQIEGYLNKKFKFLNDISIISNGNIYGVIGFDSISNSLKLFSFYNNKLKEQKLADFGRVQFASADNTGNLKILAYRNSTNELILINGKNSLFKQTKVTLARLTNSVYFFTKNNLVYYIYDEFSPDKKGNAGYQIVLISPKKDHYSKTVLFRSRNEISKFRAKFIRSKIYILFTEKGLKLLEVSLKGVN